MADLRLGIVGSARAATFPPVCRLLPGVRVTAVCDIVPELADRLAAQVGARACYDYETLLNAGIDAVILASPLPLHAEQSIQALERGIHVLCEVTACHDLASARQLAQAAAASRAVYMLAENCCYYDEIELVKRMAADGLFGAIIHAEGEYLHNCRSLLRDRSGALTWRGKGWPGIYCTHSLGPLLEILHDRVVRVTALDTGSPAHWDAEIPYPESSEFLAQTAAGRQLRIRVDYQSPRPYELYFALQGTGGAYEAARGLGDEAKVYLENDPGAEPAAEAWRPLAGYAARYIPERLAMAGRLNLGHQGSEYWLLKDFFSAVRGEIPSPIDCYRGLDYTVPGICAVLSAQRGGEPVAVPDYRTPVERS